MRRADKASWTLRATSLTSLDVTTSNASKHCKCLNWSWKLFFFLEDAYEYSCYGKKFVKLAARHKHSPFAPCLLITKSIFPRNSFRQCRSTKWQKGIKALSNSFDQVPWLFWLLIHKMAAHCSLPSIQPSLSTTNLYYRTGGRQFFFPVNY